MVALCRARRGRLREEQLVPYWRICSCTTRSICGWRGRTRTFLSRGMRTMPSVMQKHRGGAGASDRFAACKLVLHPEKTKIVYCKDANRPVTFPSLRSIFWVFSSEPEGQCGGRSKAHLCAQLSIRCQPESAEAHSPDDLALGASSPQRQILD